MENHTFQQPLQNEKGMTVILLLVLVSIIVGYFSLYSANYYLELTSQINHSKRILSGIATLQQSGQLLIDTHQKYKKSLAAGNAYAGACPDQTPHDKRVHELCVRPTDTNKNNGNCVLNPLGEPELLCINSEEEPGSNARNIIEVSYFTPPLWYDPVVNPLKKLRFEYGKSLVATMGQISPFAHAYNIESFLPAITVATRPTIEKLLPNVSCGTSSTSNHMCIRCRNHNGAGPNSSRPECFTLKLCLKTDIDGDGRGECDRTDDKQWLWQMVAVTSEVGP